MLHAKAYRRYRTLEFFYASQEVVTIYQTVRYKAQIITYFTTI